MALSKVPVVAGTKTLARGSVVIGNASGEPSALAIGSNTYVLKSDGTDISWGADQAGTITAFTNGVDNRVVTATSATALNGEANFIYNGTIVGAGADGANADLGSGIHIKTADSGASVSSEADELVIEHGNAIGGMSFLAATDGLTKIAFGDSGNNDAGIIHYSHDGTHMAFTVEGAEKMRILSGGQFLVGTTAMKADGFCSISFPGASTRGMTLFDYEADSTANFMQFNSNGTECGRVQKNGTNSVSFTTSSDYRLKENVDYDFDATTRLKELKPARFNWIADETNTLVDGFIAHEISSVIPEAITGTKDAMHPEVLYTADDELPEGKNIGDVKEATKINPQGIDQSKLVPLLTKALQEAITKIETLETKVTALENA